jgi:hypothetical protein
MMNPCSLFIANSLKLILCELRPHNRDKLLKAVWWEEEVAKKPTEAGAAIKNE